MEGGQAAADPRPRPDWNPFAKKPLGRWQAAGFAILPAALVVGFFSQAVHDAWVASTWQRATATVAGEARQARTGRSGPSYDAPLTATLPDGRIVSGYSLRPFHARGSTNSAGDSATLRRLPTPGYELAVRIDPSDPRAMLPESAMVHEIPAQIGINLIVVGVLARLLFQFFRGEQPRLNIRTEDDVERARAKLRDARDRQSVGAPHRESL
jgi:hypothetical protein